MKYISWKLTNYTIKQNKYITKFSKIFYKGLFKQSASILQNYSIFYKVYSKSWFLQIPMLANILVLFDVYILSTVYNFSGFLQSCSTC